MDHYPTLWSVEFLRVLFWVLFYSEPSAILSIYIFHLYADDTQLYVSIKSDDRSQITTLETEVDLRSWCSEVLKLVVSWILSLYLYYHLIQIFSWCKLLLCSVHVTSTSCLSSSVAPLQVSNMIFRVRRFCEVCALWTLRIWLTVQTVQTLSWGDYSLLWKWRYLLRMNEGLSVEQTSHHNLWERPTCWCHHH